MKKALLICLVAIALIGLVACKQDPKTCRISFDANGGTGEKMADLTAEYDKEVTLTKNTYTRTGYTFAGWSDYEEAHYAEYYDEDIFKTKEDITLYAIWEADLSNSTWEATTPGSTKVRLQFDDEGCFTMSFDEEQYNGDFIVDADNLMLEFAETKTGDPTEIDKFAYFKSPEEMDVVIVSVEDNLNPADLDFTRDFNEGKYLYPSDFEAISNPTHEDWRSVNVYEIDDNLLFNTVHGSTLIARNYTYIETEVYTCTTDVPQEEFWTFGITSEHTKSELISTEFVYDVTPEESTLSFYFGRMHIGEYLEFTKVVE